MRSLSAVVCLLLLVPVSAAPPKRHGSSSLLPPTLDVGPQFDPTRDRLPPGFTGNNFLALYQRLSIAPKGEFETTDQYQARPSAVPAATYAFVLPRPETKYDADNRSLTVQFYTEFVHKRWELQTNSSMLVIRESEQETGRYVGSNAFGASVVVKKVTRRYWGVFLSNKDFSAYNLTFGQEPGAAKAAKVNIRVLAIVKIGPESIPERMTDEQFPDMHDATGFDISGATVDAPTDLKQYYYCVGADVLGFWVFDARTGEVFARGDGDGHVVQAVADVHK